ncbi:glycosyltransferase [Acidiferrobacter sp.]|uniref:glycosyltransferase n=1 Tax=Acidiferrobacter sp. TaxID=1872107 RepID=UPI00260AA89F|nr:glycosyltransferase [Acidiferrobacter sp.]
MSAPHRYLFVAAGPDWGRHPCSLSHIIGVVVRNHPVIWINSIAQRSPRLSRRDIVRAVHKGWASLRPAPRRKHNGPLVVHPRALPYHRLPSVRSVNGWLIARQLRPVLARFGGYKVIFVATNPAAVALANSLQPDATIYFCMDDYARMHDSDARLIEVCERLMLARADATVVTARALVDSKTWQGRRPIYMPQGVDVAHFQNPGPLPAALSALPRPIIGFQGIIGARVDIELLEKIARRFPEASLVLVGREEVDITPLKRLPNVHAVGPVAYADLPSVIQVFDVGLVAYRDDEHVGSVNPLKLLEYLALGQEVVSVPIPELAAHEPHVRCARGHEDYVVALEAVIARYPFDPADKARRLAYAAAQSWEMRARDFMGLCDELVGKPGLSPPAKDRMAGARQRTGS